MEPSLPTLTRVCTHLSLCNGCPGMEIPYVQQYANKKKAVEQTLQYYLEDVEMVPADSLQFYRNKCDYWYDPSSQLGFRSREDSYQAFASPSCQLLSDKGQKAYVQLASLLHAAGFPPYSLMGRSGYLRYVVFRESKTDGHLVIGLYTFTLDHSPQMETIAQSMIDGSYADGVVWIHSPQFNDTTDGIIHQAWGETLLTEKMNGIPYTYDFRCFFQTNPRMAEKVQTHVTGLVAPQSTVLDLYCGVGLFSIPLLMKGHWVKGIELSAESILYARKNAHGLGMNDDSFSFETGDVPKKIQELEKANEKFSTILLDPPRSGLSKKIWRRILRLGPAQIIYVSCNLTALQRDLEWLEEYCTFTISSARAFDLFPHTNHVETVVDIHIDSIKEYPKGGF